MPARRTHLVSAGTPVLKEEVSFIQRRKYLLRKQCAHTKSVRLRIRLFLAQIDSFSSQFPRLRYGTQRRSCPEKGPLRITDPQGRGQARVTGWGTSARNEQSKQHKGPWRLACHQEQHLTWNVAVGRLQGNGGTENKGCRPSTQETESQDMNRGGRDLAGLSLVSPAPGAASCTQ